LNDSVSTARGINVHFTKYHGLGNDFIFIEDFKGMHVSNGESMAKMLCHRQFGIGADGLVFITMNEDIYTMRIFNSDGTEAEMCGNAIRCMADYLVRNNLVKGHLLQIGTISGVKKISVNDGLYVVDMGEPDFTFNGGDEVKIDSHGKIWTADAVSMGNPHAVIFVDDLDNLDFLTWGPRLEEDEVWPEKANIEFTQVISDNRLKVKVWERGVGPTLACGTGACAAAVAAIRRGLVSSPVQVSLPGGDLTIEWEDNRVFMAGPATKVFTGSVKIKN